MRTSSLLAAVLFVPVVAGCQGTGHDRIDGSADYSLGGKEINPPNQVEVQNPYSFGVKVLWQDKEVLVPAHGQRLILFEGMNEAGAIRVYKLDSNGNQTSSALTYVTEWKPFRTGRIYQIR